DSTTQDLTTTVTWSSSATSVATISNASSSEGVATGVSIGSTTITAIDPSTSISDTATLNVTAPGIALRGASSAGQGSGVTTLTLTTPTETVAGDVMVAAIAIRPYTASITTPSGWTLVRRSDASGGASNSLAVYTRTATSSEPSSHAFTFSSSTGSAGGLLVFREVDASSPVAVHDGQSNASSLSHPAPSISPASADRMLVTAHGFSSAATWTPPSGMTEAADAASESLNALGISMSAHYELLSSSGATGARTAVASNDADTGNGIALALTPQ
ncbi:MAG: Ig-like domain-containing protein, partial [Planctomycetes bacterium]|nr:Ig-like domain-containing protein [Planctomycetota bacterium]